MTTRESDDPAANHSQTHRIAGDFIRARGFDRAPVALAAFDSRGHICVANRLYRELLAFEDHPIAERDQENPAPAGHGALPAGVPATETRERADDVAIQLRRAATPDGGWVETAAPIGAADSETVWFENLVHYDDLTGLANRDRFRSRLQEAIDQGLRGAVISIKINNIGELAGYIGHSGADRVLRAFAELITDKAGQDGFAGRIGDVKFAIFAKDLDNEEAATVFVERLQTTLSSKPVPIGEGVAADLQTSVGHTCLKGPGLDAGALIHEAELALAHVRETRMRQHSYTTEMSDRARRRGHITHALSHALEREEFTLAYQPKIDLLTRRPVGMETLLRWKSGDGGAVRPDEFIPVAENTGHIGPLTDWVLRQACAQTARLITLGHKDIRCAVNISTAHFMRQSVVNSVMTALDDANLEPSNLEVEITESLLLSSEDVVSQTFSWLKDIGVTIAIDDFGTGYSSMSYLSEFDIDTVKIDKSFVMTSTEDPRHAEICKAIIALSHALGMKVVAEGVETKGHVDLLSTFGCDFVQGYYFARPMPADDLERFLSAFEVD